jgi:hypothetical protein
MFSPIHISLHVMWRIKKDIMYTDEFFVFLTFYINTTVKEKRGIIYHKV